MPDVLTPAKAIGLSESQMEIVVCALSYKEPTATGQIWTPDHQRHAAQVAASFHLANQQDRAAKAQRGLTRVLIFFTAIQALTVLVSSWPW